MNERIQEIAEQNGFIHEFQSPGEQHDVLKNLKKFAELIIEECAQIGELKEQGYKDYNTEISVGFYIKQHFGVENE